MSATASKQLLATAAETDPEILGWMKGFPPAPDGTIAFQRVGWIRTHPTNCAPSETC